MIKVIGAKITELKLSKNAEGDVKISGNYVLISERGDVIARQEFNGYNTIQFSFNPSFMKDVVDAVEDAIEQQTGIQSGIQSMAQVTQATEAHKPFIEEIS